MLRENGTMNLRRREPKVILEATVDRWNDIEGFRLGAALSFYTTFSIFPLLLLSITVVGFLIGNDEPARDRVLSAISDPASPVRDVLDRTLASMQASRGSRGLSAFIGLSTLLFSASGAAVELQFTLNRIWGVIPRKTQGVRQILQALLLERLAGFAIIGAIAVTLLASLVVSAVFGFLVRTARIEDFSVLTTVLEHAVAIVVLAFAVSMAFHRVPHTTPPLREVLPGGLLTAVLLTILKTGFATYLERLASYSAYGIVGSVLALAAWIYLSSLVFLFGATLTAEWMGSSPPVPALALAESSSPRTESTATRPNP